MSGPMDLDRRIDAFFAEGPALAPDQLLGQSLRAASASRQMARPSWPRGMTGSRPRDVALVLIGASTALLVGGLVLWGGGLIPMPGPTDSAVPGATSTLVASPISPSPRPTATVAPLSERIQLLGLPITIDPSGWAYTRPVAGRYQAPAGPDPGILDAPYLCGDRPAAEFRAWVGDLVCLRLWPVTAGEVEARAIDEVARVERGQGIPGGATLTSIVKREPIALPVAPATRVTWSGRPTGESVEVVHQVYFFEAGGAFFRLEGAALAADAADALQRLLTIASTIRSVALADPMPTASPAGTRVEVPDLAVSIDLKGWSTGGSGSAPARALSAGPFGVDTSVLATFEDRAFVAVASFGGPPMTLVEAEDELRTSMGITSTAAPAIALPIGPAIHLTWTEPPFQSGVFKPSLPRVWHDSYLIDVGGEILFLDGGTNQADAKLMAPRFAALARSLRRTPLDGRVPIPGTSLTVDLDGWTLPGSHAHRGLRNAQLAEENPGLAAAGGVASSSETGMLAYRDLDAFARIFIVGDGSQSTLASAVGCAVMRGSLGNVTVESVALPVGPSTRIACRETVLGSNGATYEITRVAYVLEVDGTTLRLLGAALAADAAEQVPAIDALARTLEGP